MIPWELLDTAPIPGDGATLRLLRRGTEYAIHIGREPLMNSRLSGSEKALADLACARTRRRDPVVLIGGLGMGFTLRAALDALGPDARVVVAELVPAVVAWGRGPLRHLSGDALDDPRVTVCEGDVRDVIRAGAATYDAILLDVDNGPDGLTRQANDRLYDLEGLGAAKAALRPAGTLAVWSAAPDKRFGQRLQSVGLAVEETTVRANAGRSGARHTIWLASRMAVAAPAWQATPRRRGPPS